MTGSLREELDKAVDGAGHHIVEVQGRRAEVDAHDADRIGVVIERIKVSGPKMDVGERAERIADRVRPGGEAVVPIEVDPGLRGAVLRTDPERMKGGRFYQVDVDEAGAELTRHRRTEDGGRAAETFTVTREQLGDLVDGLSSDPPADEAP